MKPRIDEYKYGEVRYCDCMDEDYGLPSLEDKSWELCLTDPPYNKKFNGYHSKLYNMKNYRENIIYYKDNMKPEEYQEWCMCWFRTLKKITKSIIISVGITNLEMWFRCTNVSDILYNYNRMGKFGSRITIFNKIEPWLYYGNCKQQFNLNVLEFERMDKHNCLHPCPRDYNVVEFIIKRLEPTSVIDPFLGSGTTAEVCEKLGIKWLGYEINEVYSQDIEKRLKNIRVEPKQISLETF